MHERGGVLQLDKYQLVLVGFQAILHEISATILTTRYIITKIKFELGEVTHVS